MPLSIDLELKFESGEIINGPIKESGLSIKSTIHFAPMVSQLPGKWFTLGIIDERTKRSANYADQSLSSMIDQISNSMSDFI